MMNEKKYIVEKWIRITELFDTRERAIKEKEMYEKNKNYKDIKIFETEKIIKELK